MQADLKRLEVVLRVREKQFPERLLVGHLDDDARDLGNASLARAFSALMSADDLIAAIDRADMRSMPFNPVG
jgi:hypothetical protein